MKLEKLSALKLSELVRSKVLSPVEVIYYFQNRVTKRNPSINAIVQEHWDYAYEKAKILENKIMQNKLAGCGCFSGVPIVLKDFLPTKKSWISTRGGIPGVNITDSSDSEFYKAIEYLGAIPIGKTNAPNYGFSGLCYNKRYGFTSNPFDVEYNSGGSSGGTAAAVADGLVPIGEAGDAGGSIRIPAAFCNCFGFKPSKYRVPNSTEGNLFAANAPYCSSGCITRSVDDSIAVYRRMFTRNKLDPNSIDMPLDNINIGMRFDIGVTLDFGIFETDDEIRSKILNVASMLSRYGCTVTILDSRYLLSRSADDYEDMWCRSLMCDSVTEIDNLISEGIDIHDMDYHLVQYYHKAQQWKYEDRMNFQIMQSEIYTFYRKIFDDFDILISPVTECVGVKNEDIRNDEPNMTSVRFAETFLANFTGNPSASVPIGLSSSGLPIGMQVTGDLFKDELVLAFCKMIENIIPWDYDEALNRTI